MTQASYQVEVCFLVEQAQDEWDEWYEALPYRTEQAAWRAAFEYAANDDARHVEVREGRGVETVFTDEWTEDEVNERVALLMAELAENGVHV